MSAVKSRRRAPAEAVPTGRDQFFVMGPGGEKVRSAPFAAVALVKAQTIIQRTEPDEYTIVRESLFGPPVELYRVVRDEHGTVFTFTLNPED